MFQEQCICNHFLQQKSKTKQNKTKNGVLKKAGRVAVDIPFEHSAHTKVIFL